MLLATGAGAGELLPNKPPPSSFAKSEDAAGLAAGRGAPWPRLENNTNEFQFEGSSVGVKTFWPAHIQNLRSASHVIEESQSAAFSRHARSSSTATGGAWAVVGWALTPLPLLLWVYIEAGLPVV